MRNLDFRLRQSGRPPGALRRTASEPVGAIGDPPGGSQNWKRRRHRPPQRQCEIRDKSQSRKRQPEYFSLHAASLLANRPTSIVLAGPLSAEAPYGICCALSKCYHGAPLTAEKNGTRCLPRPAFLDSFPAIEICFSAPLAANRPHPQVLTSVPPKEPPAARSVPFRARSATLRPACARK